MRKPLRIALQLLFVATSMSGQMKYGASDDQKDYPAALAREEKWVASHPRYSFSNSFHMTPEELIGEVEMRADWPNWLVQQIHLVEAAKAALLLGKDAEAKDFAGKALQLSSGVPPSDWSYYAPVIYYSNLVLGRIALDEDNVSEAERYLLLSGKAEGHYAQSLDGFGPNMSLARELIKRGSGDVVLKFLEECKTFWTHSSQLDTWIAQIRKGEMPVFGANLRY